MSSGWLYARGVRNKRVLSPTDPTLWCVAYEESKANEWRSGNVGRVQRMFRTITTLDNPNHSVLNATIVGSSLRSDTQIRSAEVNSVMMSSLKG